MRELTLTFTKSMDRVTAIHSNHNIGLSLSVTGLTLHCWSCGINLIGKTFENRVRSVPS